MRNSRQHRRALRDLALDALAHRLKGRRRLAHFARAFGLEAEIIPSLAEILGGLGKAPDRFHLIAHENDRDAEQDQRRSHRPQTEGDRGRAEQALARHQRPQHAVAELDTDRHQAGMAQGIDREGTRQSLGESVIERFLDPVARPPAARGQDRTGLKGHDHILGCGKKLEHLFARLRRRFGRKQVDDHGDIAGDSLRQPVHDLAPMGVVENDRRDELDHGERGDQDRERAPQQRLGQEPFDGRVHGRCHPQSKFKA